MVGESLTRAHSLTSDSAKIHAAKVKVVGASVEHPSAAKSERMHPYKLANPGPLALIISHTPPDLQVCNLTLTTRSMRVIFLALLAWGRSMT